MYKELEDILDESDNIVKEVIKDKDSYNDKNYLYLSFLKNMRKFANILEDEGISIKITNIDNRRSMKSVKFKEKTRIFVMDINKMFTIILNDKHSDYKSLKALFYLHQDPFYSKLFDKSMIETILSHSNCPSSIYLYLIEKMNDAVFFFRYK